MVPLKISSITSLKNNIWVEVGTVWLSVCAHLQPAVQSLVGRAVLALDWLETEFLAQEQQSRLARLTEVSCSKDQVKIHMQFH